MGRHSASDDLDEDVDLDARAVDGAANAANVALATERRGRHSRPAPAAAPGLRESEGEDAPAEATTTKIALADIARDDRPVQEETTIRIAAVAEAPADEQPLADASSPEPVPAVTSGRPPAGDLTLIREHGDVRARAIAAVIAPFVVFVVVFVVRGDLEIRSLIWIWIPAIVAGVLVGVVLDAGHKRYTGPPST